MQLTVRSNHAMRLMMYCALNDGRLAPVSEIARACNMSEAHLAKIANRLASHGFVETVRGRGGGVRLAADPETLSVGAVVRTTEMGACLIECLDVENNTCPLIDACKFRGVVGRALEAFLKVLDDCTLAELIAEGDDLKALMGIDCSGPRLSRAPSLSA
ncbi:Rrf2 family transcriptional regulator [Rhodovulum sp. DZ06]|uniref:Rrf2 family transcriptional regulator n=1 Tax=Rhodovulum sp. DZ06 TaxID=3425126 RepID=UPI003D34F229